MQMKFIGESSAPTAPWVLWYRHPANAWVEALPVGNGRLGGMVFGGVENERISLNESTLWSGSPTTRVEIRSTAGQPCIIACGPRDVRFVTRKGQTLRLTGELKTVE